MLANISANAPGLLLEPTPQLTLFGSPWSAYWLESLDLGARLSCPMPGDQEPLNPEDGKALLEFGHTEQSKRIGFDRRWGVG